MVRVSLRSVTFEGGYTAHNLVRCPSCGHPFERYEPRWKHFLDDRSPEDFGLSPLGTIPPDHARPLFGGEAGDER